MNPVPDRHTFIATVNNVLLSDFYEKLKEKGYTQTTFFHTIEDCLFELYESKKPKNEFDVDIQLIHSKIASLNDIGYGLDVSQVHTLHDLKTYLREYIHSQKIYTNTKQIPPKYTEQDEKDFIEDAMDFLGTLYNMSHKTTKLSKSIRECVEIFWEYNVTWKRIQRDATLGDMQNLRDKMGKIYLTRDDDLSDVGKKFTDLRRYLTDWFYFKKNPTSKSTPDINTRVEELEQEVKELRALVRDLTFQHPPELNRQALLKQLARHA
jgi:uncharacterized protein YjaG (DUF416 family)